MSSSSSSSSATSGVHSESKIDSIAFRPPQWSPNNVEAWLRIIESQFAIAGIKLPNTKYNNVIAALPPEIITRVLDATTDNISPTAEEYNTLITAIRTRTVATKQSRLHAVLDTEEIGDKTPSQFYHHLKQLSSGVGVTEEIILDRWLQKLPDQQIRQTLIGLNQSLNDVEKLLSVADAMMEMSRSNVAATSRYRKQRSRSQDHSRSPSRNRSNRKYDPNGSWCFNHFKYRNETRNCQKPGVCQYKQKNQQSKQ